MLRHLLMITLFLATTMGAAGAAEPLKVGVFAVDASPPVGSPMAYDPTKGVVHPLSCRGVVLVGEGQTDRALRRRLDRDRQRRAGGVPQGAGRRPRGPIRSGSRSTRCTSTTRRSAISRPTACSPSRGSTARSSTRPSPAT